TPPPSTTRPPTATNSALMESWRLTRSTTSWPARGCSRTPRCCRTTRARAWVPGLRSSRWTTSVPAVSMRFRCASSLPATCASTRSTWTWWKRSTGAPSTC
ncbi:MAG: hypothetical protein AVDCRST_MAG51-2307, partial [uncultured Ramlibacter sp.]